MPEIAYTNAIKCQYAEYTINHTHTHPFNGPLSGTTQVSQYQKGKTNLDFTEARDSEWQWHQLGHNTSLHLVPDRQPHQHPTTGRMPFLPPNQQRQSTEGKKFVICVVNLQRRYSNHGVKKRLFTPCSNTRGHRSLALFVDARRLQVQPYGMTPHSATKHSHNKE